MKLKLDWFLCGMVIAVALAWAFPAPGAHGGWLRPELLNKAGVALIFFLSGVSLSFAAMKAGALRWPVHVIVQLTTFLIFPLIGVGMLWLTQRWISVELSVGFFFLCALPSTVSSSVAMTAAARGNVPAAVFNATLSSLIGVVITPLWISWRLHADGQSVDVVKVILDLMLWLVLPLVLGQLSRPWLAEWAKRNKKFIQVADRGTILLIIYTSFCDSIMRGVWSGQGVSVVLIAAVGALVLFFVAMWIVEGMCKVARLNAADRIAAVFCGSKKTIATGVPMAQVIFATDPRLGVILLPLMIYHPLQLVICGVLAARWAKRSGD